MPNIEYQFIASESDLQRLVEGMKEYASKHIFDTKKAAQEALDSGIGEEYGSMVRVKGPDLGSLMPYTHFITLDKKSPLQIMLVEMHMDRGNLAQDRVLQLTIVDNNKNPLKTEQLIYLVHMFLGDEAGMPDGELPPHAFVALKEIGPVHYGDLN